MTEAFICDAIRTPIGRYGGVLSGVRTDDLAALPIAALMKRNAGVDWQAVDDVILGCANQAGEDNRNLARMAALLAGLPVEVPGVTVNRLCGSGLDAVAIAARQVRSGEAQFIIAGGAESMSRAPYVLSKPDAAFTRTQQMFDTTIGWRFVNPLMKQQYGIDSMPETGENVAADFAVSRADQDAFALRSQQRALAAQANGRLAAEIVAVTLPAKKGDPTVVDRDEHPRETSLEALAKLGTPFRAGGSVTAGNASGVNDGACALVVASEAAAKRHGFKPRARILGAAVAGLPPRIMGLGPAPASEKLMARLGLSIGDFDVIELNEAFASQALAVLRRLGLPDDAAHVNPNGGAIALGHPLGMSGARLAATATLELERGGGRRALVHDVHRRGAGHCARPRAGRVNASDAVVRDGDVAVFTFDSPPVNALSHPVRAAFLAAIEALDADPGVRAIVLLGAGRNFIAGADIREFDKPPLEPLLTDVLSRLESCGKPVVAALHGAALGGGAETALACHYRCAAGDLQLGFPEVSLGLLPGAGGTVRLPRLAGWQAAFELMASGKPIGIDPAIELGLVDRRMDGDLRAGAIAWARELAAARAPLRRVSELPVPPSRPAQFEEYLRILPQASRRLPAPPRIVEALAATAMLPVEAALARARALFLECLASTESRALRHLFFAERATAPDPELARRRRPGGRARRRHDGLGDRDQPRNRRHPGDAHRCQAGSARRRARTRARLDRLRRSARGGSTPRPRRLRATGSRDH